MVKRPALPPGAGPELAGSGSGPEHARTWAAGGGSALPGSLMGQESEAPYEEVKAVGQVVKGDERFARNLFRKAAEPEQVLRWLTEARVASEVAGVLGVELDELRGPRRRRDLSRARAMAA